MTEEHAGPAGRRRGTRGGRGRGGRADGAASRPELGSDSNEPRIVGRRPGRPPAATASAEPAATTTSTTSTTATRTTPTPAARASTPAAAATATRAASPRVVNAAGEPVEPEAAPARRTPARRTTAAAAAANTDGLAAAIESLREEVRALASRVETSARRPRLGVFVDVPNLLYGAER